MALYATIKAARAGDAGKDFTVVVSKVKDLVNKTAQATRDIEVQIKAIQTATKATVSVIDEISQNIDNMSGIASTIAAAVAEQGNATDKISRNVGKTTLRPNEIKTNITTTKASTVENRDTAGQMLSVAPELDQELVQLRLLGYTFLTGMRAA